MQALLKNKVVRNFSYLTAGSIISQILLLVTVIKITNIFSPDQYGVYTFIISQGMLLHAISDLGIKAIIIRAIARNPEKTNDLVVNGIKLRTLVLFVLMGAYIIYNNLLGNLDSDSIILLFIYTVVNSFFHIFEYVFLGNQKMFLPSVVKVIHSLIWFFIVFLLPEKFFTVNILLTTFIFLNIIQAILFYYMLKTQGFFLGKVENIWSSSKSLVNESWPYFALMLLTLPTNHLSNNFLDINSSSEEVGFFNLAKKLMGPVSLIITFALTALFPNLAEMFVVNKKKFTVLISNGIGIFIALTAFASFIFTLFSREAILLFFPDSYINAIKVIQLQIWYIMLNGVNHLITITYGAVNLERKLFKLALYSAIFSTPLLYIGSHYGAYGISVAYVFSFIIYEFYFWIQFKKNIAISIKNEKLVWSAAVLFFILSYFVLGDVNLIIKVILTLFMSIGFVFYYTKQMKYLISK